MSTEKTKLREDVAELLKAFVNKRITESYRKTYTGKVVDNDDPEKKYRCKVRVYGVYSDEIPDEDLPWALMDATFVGSKIGSVVIPPNDAIVRVYFEDGDIYKPVYTTKMLDSDNLSEEASEDYPDTMVLFETDAGEYFKINRATNETEYHTASGVLITVDEDGNVAVSTEDAQEGTYGLTVKGDMDITTKGSSNITITVGGDATINAKGTTKVKGTKVILKSVDSVAWKPNILPNCLFTGAPHGGQPTINNLKGS